MTIATVQNAERLTHRVLKVLAYARPNPSEDSWISLQILPAIQDELEKIEEEERKKQIRIEDRPIDPWPQQESGIDY